MWSLFFSFQYFPIPPISHRYHFHQRHDYTLRCYYMVFPPKKKPKCVPVSILSLFNKYICKWNFHILKAEIVLSNTGIRFRNDKLSYDKFNKIIFFSICNTGMDFSVILKLWLMQTPTLSGWCRLCNSGTLSSFLFGKRFNVIFNHHLCIGLSFFSLEYSYNLFNMFKRT